MSYLYSPDDGKIHTRYSELVVCTPGQIWRVISHREDENWLSTPAIDHGRVRHEMFAEESTATGLIPATIDLPTVAGQRVQYVEQEIVGEILPGVVLHGRVDALMDDYSTVVDYKTMRAKNLKLGALQAADRYQNSKQLKLYAYLLGLNGHRIRLARYLVEIWNEDYTEILGYTMVTQQITLGAMAATLAWAEDRVSLLVSAFEKETV